jgi:hypothetical protein
VVAENFGEGPLRDGVPAPLVNTATRILQRLMNQLVQAGMDRNTYTITSPAAVRRVREAFVSAQSAMDAWFDTIDVLVPGSDAPATPTDDSAESATAFEAAVRHLLQAIHVQRRLATATQEAHLSSAASQGEEASRRGAQELGSAFLSYSSSETRAALAWSSLVLLSLSAACWIAVRFVLGVVALKWNEELARLASTLPLVAIAGYAARIANQHRENGRWHRIMAVRLQTINDFTSGLSRRDAHSLKGSFGRTVFVNSVPITPMREGVGLHEDVVALITSLGERSSKRIDSFVSASRSRSARRRLKATRRAAMEQAPGGD